MKKLKTFKDLNIATSKYLILLLLLFIFNSCSGAFLFLLDVGATIAIIVITFSVISYIGYLISDIINKRKK